MSGVIPAVHYALAKGWIHAISKASLGWLILMGVLYVLGAVVYAVRIPERWFPGKCDIWVRQTSCPILLSAQTIYSYLE